MRNFFPAANAVSAQPVSPELRECLLPHLVPRENPTEAHYDTAREILDEWEGQQRQTTNGHTEKMGLGLAVHGVLPTAHFSEEEEAFIRAESSSRRRHKHSTWKLGSKVVGFVKTLGSSNVLRTPEGHDATPGLQVLADFLGDAYGQQRSTSDLQQGLYNVGTLRAMIAYAWPRPGVETDMLPTNSDSVYYLDPVQIGDEQRLLARRCEQGADAALKAAATFEEVWENTDEDIEGHYRALCHSIDLEIRALTIQAQVLDATTRLDAHRQIVKLESEFERAIERAWSYAQYIPLDTRGWVFELYAVAMNRRAARRGKDDVRLALRDLEDETSNRGQVLRAYGVNTQLAYSYDGVVTSLADDTPPERWDTKIKKYHRGGLRRVREYVDEIHVDDFRDIPYRLILPELVN